MAADAIEHIRNVWPHYLPPEWEFSVQRFRDEGATDEQIIKAVTITLSRGRSAYWRYFCGIVWTQLRESR